MTCTIKLIAKTKKGRERLQRDGDTGWKVIQVENSVQFSDTIGPWWLISNGKSEASRWVHATNDKDFKLRIERER